MANASDKGNQGGENITRRELTFYLLGIVTGMSAMEAVIVLILLGVRIG